MFRDDDKAPKKGSIVINNNYDFHVFFMEILMIFTGKTMWVLFWFILIYEWRSHLGRICRCFRKVFISTWQRMAEDGVGSKVSNEKKPGWLFDIGDYTTQLYRGL